MQIDPSGFAGEINIPNTDEIAVQENIALLVQKYQPRFFKALMGSALYAEYLTASPDEERWVAFDELVRDPFMYYIYYWYIRNTATYVTNSGTSASKQENSTIVSPGERMVFAWNEMVDMVREVRKGWDATVYGEYYLASRCRLPDIFHKQNNLNI